MQHNIIPFSWRSQASLLKKALDGDIGAANHLVRQLSPKAHAVAWRILGNESDAEDVLQEAFIRLFRASQFDGNASLDTYFYKIVTHLCFDFLKNKHRLLLDISDDMSNIGDDSSSADQILEARQEMLTMQEALQLLNYRQRTALVLWAYKDAEISEIANVLSIDSNAAHQLLHRAKANLKKILEG